MISLDDEQLGILMALATPLHPDQRGPFVETVIAVAAAESGGELGVGVLHRVGADMQRNFMGRPPTIRETHRARKA